ncbi:MAG: hypothetical protein GX129_04845 [Clostridiales bacterium]|jgi:hypothetical protein|nr:hypothetical protein [Clostridiales bacterium]
MNKIIPLKRVGRECMEDTLISILSSMREDYRWIYYTKWSFDFINNIDKQLIGEQLKVDWGSIEENSLKYLGIDIQYLSINEASKAYNIIVNQIMQGKPVVVVDYIRFHHWIKVLQGQADTHSIIVHNITVDGDLLCSDCLTLDSDIVLNKDVFLKAYHGPIVLFYEIDVAEGDIDYEADLLSVVSKRYSSIDYDNSFEAMRSFAEAVKKMDIMKECPEAQEQAVWLSPICHKFELLSIGRVHFAGYLNLYAQRSSKKAILEASEIIEKAGIRWGMLRALLMKLRYMEGSRKIQERISEIIHELASDEYMALTIIKNTVY